ncbi:MAG: glycosyltransferase family 2 protein [Bacteroidia bacterium]|nr:glycosyltransferase family 2 protein [Bacteroidia bacterium]
MVKTAVVILNWNGIEYLKLFLDKVISYTVNDDTILYVADNGSVDGSVEWISVSHKEVKIIRLGKNHGFAGGYNLALEQVDAQYYVLLNSDIEVTKGWLHPLINYLDNNRDVASCQPKILSYGKRDHFEYAGAAGGFIDRYGYPLCRGRILTCIEKDTGQYDNTTDIFWSTGACMAVRAEAWKKCGGFDADFFAHMEEIDLCWRFHRSGYRVSYVPQSSVYHVGGGTLPYDSPFKTYLNFRNSLFLLYKNLPDKMIKRILFIRKILDGIAALFFMLKGQFRSVGSVWKAHKDYYREMDHLKEKRKIVKELCRKENAEMILNKSIVFEFYIKRHRTYAELKTKFLFS